jgi:hypothetical protein
LGVGLKPYPVIKKIVEKPPRNSAGFCGGGQGLRWAVEARGERERELINDQHTEAHEIYTFHLLFIQEV